MRRLIGLLATLALAPIGAFAQSPPPNACGATAFHALDFWIGEWVVRGPKGREIGRSRIERILGGCALHEHWLATSGEIGESLTSFDPATKRWRQHWIEGDGTVSDYVGDADRTDVVMTAPGIDPKGKAILYRMRFSPLPDGRVRQHIDQSADAGSTWSLSFEGFYSRT